MSIFNLLLFIFIGYLCFKAIRSILRDAFGGIGTQTAGNKSKSNKQQTYYEQSASGQNKKKNSRPIEKGEGEYVDFEDV